MYEWRVGSRRSVGDGQQSTTFLGAQRPARRHHHYHDGYNDTVVCCTLAELAGRANIEVNDVTLKTRSVADFLRT